MHINTRTRQEMIQSICRIFNMNHEQFQHLLITLYQKFEKDRRVLILDDQYDYLKEYICQRQRETIDKVSFFHLSRRLKDCQDDNGYPLKDVLMKCEKVKNFFLQYHISFQDDQQRIHIYKDQQEILLENHHDYTIRYLKERLDHTHQDNSIKGYAFEECLKFNEMYEVYRNGPEILHALQLLLGVDTLLDDFYQQSQYTLYEYLVPIDDIYFEDYDDLTNHEKQLHILIKTIQRLYDDQFHHQNSDFENPIMGMIDNHILDKKYLIQKTREF